MRKQIYSITAEQKKVEELMKLTGYTNFSKLIQDLMDERLKAIKNNGKTN